MNGLLTASNLVSNSAFEAIYNKGRDWQLLLIGIGVVFFSQFVLIAGGESTDGTIPNSGRFGLILGFLMVAIAAYFFDARLRHAPWSVSFPRTLRFNIEGSRKLIFGVGVLPSLFDPEVDGRVDVRRRSLDLGSWDCWGVLVRSHLR